ncbi:hypothetical protein KUCAC02_002515, partial [Chaenocephalus aceratus]
VQPPNLGLGHSLLFTEEVDGERRVWDTEQGEEGDTEGPGLVQRSIEMEKQHCSRPEVSLLKGRLGNALLLPIFSFFPPLPNSDELVINMNATLPNRAFFVNPESHPSFRPQPNPGASQLRQ